jgi:hypothetical protein
VIVDIHPLFSAGSGPTMIRMPVLASGSSLLSGGAVGVAAIGTVFFSTLRHSGFTAAISQSLEIQLGVAAVLFVLSRALPRRPRDTEAAEIEPAAKDHATVTAAAP